MDKDIKEKFQKLYYQKFKIQLTDEEATQMSADLINLMKVLLKPDKQEVTTDYAEEGRKYATVTT